MLQTLKVTVKVPMQQATVMPAILLLHAIAGLLQDAVFFSSGYDGGVVWSMMSTTIGGLETAKKASANDLGGAANGRSAAASKLSGSSVP